MDDAVAKVNHSHDILTLKHEDLSGITQTLELVTKDLGEKVTECMETKLDESIYDKEMNRVLDHMNQLDRRLAVGEEEAREFADFVLRYTPLLTHNTITEHLNSCLDSK